MDGWTKHRKKCPVSTIDTMTVDAHLGQTASGRRRVLNEASTTPMHWIRQFRFARFEKPTKQRFPPTKDGRVLHLPRAIPTRFGSKRTRLVRKPPSVRNTLQQKFYPHQATSSVELDQDNNWYSLKTLSSTSCADYPRVVCAPSIATGSTDGLCRCV